MATGTTGASRSAVSVLTANPRPSRTGSARMRGHTADDDQPDLGQDGLEDARGQAEEQDVADDPPGRARR